MTRRENPMSPAGAADTLGRSRHRGFPRWVVLPGGQAVAPADTLSPYYTVPLEEAVALAEGYLRDAGHSPEPAAAGRPH